MNRTARALLLGSFLALVVGRPVLGQQSLNDLSGPWQLFVDDYAIAARQNLVRTYHPFEKHAGNPVLVGDRPWEYGDRPGQGIVYLYGTVLPNENGPGYRMWYACLPYFENGYTGSGTLYATSSDGLTWTKPNLGIRTWNGSTNNNMFYSRTSQSGITSVIHTPWDPNPARRYRFMNFELGDFWGAYSPDGVQTIDVMGNPVFTGGSDVGQFLWDPHTQRYRGYVKNGWNDWNGLSRRAVALTETTDIEQWPSEQIILTPDPYDDRWSGNTTHRTHFYGLSAFAYESMYVGLLWIFRANDAQGYFNGPVFAEIVTSRDGVTWARQEGTRPAMLPVGPPGSWDDGQLYTATQPLVEGGVMKLWYGGCNEPHGSALKITTCSIGLATLRKDGFASLDAGPTPGLLTTRTLLNATGQLRVNCAASAGSLRVEVLDASENVVPGYGVDDCVPVQADGVNLPVAWASHQALPALAGGLRLRFTLQNGSLYSFRTDEPVQIVASPTITQHPQSRTVCPGTSVQLSVTAQGQGSLSYRWRRAGVELSDSSRISGAQTPTLTIDPAYTADAGEYTCVVSNDGGPTTSNPATMSLETVSFTGIGLLTGSATSVTGMTADGSVLCGDSNGRIVLWSASGGLVALPLPVGATSVTSAGIALAPGGGLVVAVNTNAATSKAKRWSGDASGAGSYSSLPLFSGQEWKILGIGSSGTDFWLAGSTFAGGDYGGRNAVLYRHSTGAVVSPALPANGHDNSDFHTVSDTGAAAGQYQYGSTGATGGARNAMRYSGSGSCVAYNTLLGAPTTKNEAIARAISRNGTVLGGSSTYIANLARLQPVIWTGPTAPVAIPFIPGGDGDNEGAVLALNGDGTVAGGYTFYSGSPANGPRQAFIWTSASGTRSLRDSLASDYGLDLQGWTLEEVRAISADGTVIAGVGTHNGVAEGWIVKLGGSAPAPEILQQPEPQRVPPGSPATFSVVATGAAPLTYRWQHDGADITDGEGYLGATAPTLQVTALDPQTVGSYRCVISVPCGVTFSMPASLVPLVAPDLDEDGDVDSDDLGLFTACVLGPGVPAGGECTSRDFDVDGDVDHDDFGTFQRCYSGDGHTPNLACIP